jgi:hypothetical protein
VPPGSAVELTVQKKARASPWRRKDGDKDRDKSRKGAPGREEVAVPRLVGMPLPRARVELAKAGLALGKVSYVRSRGHKGEVVSQSPARGRKVAKGTKVNLVVRR